MATDELPPGRRRAIFVSDEQWARLGALQHAKGIRFQTEALRLVIDLGIAAADVLDIELLQVLLEAPGVRQKGLGKNTGRFGTTEKSD